MRGNPLPCEGVREVKSLREEGKGWTKALRKGGHVWRGPWGQLADHGARAGPGRNFRPLFILRTIGSHLMFPI